MEYEKDINFVCANTHLRIVNQIIYEEYIIGKDHKKENWSKKASNRLRNSYGISLNSDTLKGHLSKIKHGKRNPICASNFICDCDYKSTSRYEKDMMHAQMDMLQHQYIEGETFYVGLPANQIVSVSRKYDNVVACERNISFARYMFKMNKFISKSTKLSVIHNDIFNYINRTDEKFNIYDFDLMTYIDESLINKIANCVNKTSMDRSLVVITTIGGRKITINDYKKLMPSKLLESLSQFKLVCKPFSGKYKDHKMPMMYEMIVIERK